MSFELQATQGSDNVFRDLGFPEAEAQNLLLRSDLAIHIRKVIDKLGITQAEAAKRAGITQPRMNDLVKNRTHKFTLDALVDVAANLGYSVKLTLILLCHKRSRRFIELQCGQCPRVIARATANWKRSVVIEFET